MCDRQNILFLDEKGQKSHKVILFRWAVLHAGCADPKLPPPMADLGCLSKGYEEGNKPETNPSYLAVETHRVEGMIDQA